MLTTKPEVKLLCDSINPNGQRLTTFQVKYWRPLLPEMNTHRVFSRNAASSRAMSFSKRCKQVVEDTVLPTHWNSEKPGMVGGDEFDQETKDFINRKIIQLAGLTTEFIEQLNNEVKAKTGYEIHKQYLNRYLEPFTYTTQIITSTDWDNFFKLRLAPDAQPEIRDVALEMFYALNESNPKKLRMGDYHLPYVLPEELEEYGHFLACKISVARCARVSYRAYEGHVKLEKDLELFDRLLKSGHMSPFEHVAVPVETDKHYFNLHGWMSLRYAIETQEPNRGTNFGL